MGKQFERKMVTEILTNLSKKIPLIHIIIGPRQVGKTVAAHQIIKKWQGESIYSAADLPLPPGPEWIQSHWENARLKAQKNKPVLLVLDEIQKVSNWSEVLKRLWDEEKRRPKKISVIVLGSSSLMLQHGLSESLAGRFFKYPCYHWSYQEMKKAFGQELHKWLFFGGYPGAAPFTDDFTMWSRYINDSLIETVLSRDILQLQTVTKPALLRNLFGLSVTYPAQIYSYNKMLGQLHDAGNTTTLAHYLKLLETAFLVSGLESFKKGKISKRGSSPKLIVWNNALINSLAGQDYQTVMSNNTLKGRLVENAAISHLLNHLHGPAHSISYWRQGHDEVDAVIQTPKNIWALEIKSGRTGKFTGLRKFIDAYPKSKPLIIGEGGLPLEEFFSTDPNEIFV